MLEKVPQYMFNVIRMIGMALLIAMGILLFFNIVFRTFGITVSWIHEIVELANVWMVFLGAAVLLYDKSHISLDLFNENNVGPRTRKVQEWLISTSVLLVTLLLLFGGFQLLMEGQSQVSPILRLPRSLWYAAIPVAGLLMLLAIFARLSDLKFNFKHQKGSEE